MSVYVVSHKTVELNHQLPKCYKWLYVGTEKSGLEVPNGAYSDTTGDSISTLNDSYCELTALYWLWKNCMDDYKGICHYRRFFVSSLLSKSLGDVLNEEAIQSELLAGRCIVSSRRYVHGCVKSNYEQYHISDDYCVLRNALLKIDPSTVSTFDNMSELNYLYPYNMLIANKQMYDEYCAWLFEILFKAQESINLAERDDYQKRVFGFLSERLLGVWIEKNHVEIAEYPVLNTDARRRFRVRLFLESIIKRAL